MGASNIETWVLPILTILSGIITSLITSQGLWAHLSAKWQKDSAESELLRGLAHTRIMSLCVKYIDRGWITPAEYEDLITYLYQPYLKLGGSCVTVQKMVDNEVSRLPIHHVEIDQDIVGKENKS